MVVAGFYVIYGFTLTPYKLSKVCSKYNQVYLNQIQKVEEKYPIKDDATSDDLECRLEDMNDEIRNMGFDNDIDVLDYEDHLNDNRFTLVRGSHYPRWTDYSDNGEVFFGLVQHYRMDPCGKEYPFKDFSKRQKHQLEQYCQNVFPDGEIEIEYHIYPDDCNCCS